MKTGQRIIINISLFLFSIFTTYSSEHIISEDISRFHSSNSKTCIICHPSNNEDGNKSVDWDSELSYTIYTPYSSLSLDANVRQPSESSKVCLSCHDGTIAIDELGSPILNGTRFSNDLRGNHPISFEYTSFLATKDGQLHDPISSASGLGGTINQDLLVDGKLECISCHDVHNLNNIKNLLVKSNYRSALCLTCHNK